MKLASSVSRYLLGFIFVVFGLNGFLNFIPPQPLPALAMQFFGSLVTSHYSLLIFALQFVLGVLLLAASANRSAFAGLLQPRTSVTAR